MKELIFKACLSLVPRWGWFTYPWDANLCRSQGLDPAAMILAFPHKEALATEFISMVIQPPPLCHETLKDDLFEAIFTCIEAIDSHRTMVLEIVLYSSPLFQKALLLQMITLFSASLPFTKGENTSIMCGSLMTAIYLRALVSWCYQPLDTVMMITDQWITKTLPLFSYLLKGKHPFPPHSPHTHQ